MCCQITPPLTFPPFFPHNKNMIPALLIAAALALGIPSLSFVSPAPGQTITGPKIAVKIAVANFALVDYKTHPKLVPGQGHLHLWLDQTKPTKTSAVKAVSPAYTFENVKPGTHTLIAELVANDHSSLTPITTTSVTFTTASPSLLTTQLSLLTPIVIAFLSLALTLYFVSTVKPKTGKSLRKSRSKLSKSHSRK